MSLDTARIERRHVVVFGRVVTRKQALAVSLELHRRGDYDGGLRALQEAGLTPHDLIEWTEGRAS